MATQKKAAPIEDTKAPEQPVKESGKAALSPDEKFTVIGTGKNAHFRKGDEYTIYGAQEMIDAGYVTLKK